MFMTQKFICAFSHKLKYIQISIPKVNRDMNELLRVELDFVPEIVCQSEEKDNIPPEIAFIIILTSPYEYHSILRGTP